MAARGPPAGLGVAGPPPPGGAPPPPPPPPGGAPPPPPGGAPPPPPGPPPGPPPAVAFSNAIITAINNGIDPSGYELQYDVYSTSLEPSLRFQYSEPEVRPPRPRRDPEPPPAAAAVPGRGTSLASIKTALLLPTSHLITAPNNWTKNRIRRLVDDAAQAVPPDVPGAVFDQNAFAIAILPQLNDLVLQNARRDRAPLLAAPIPIIRPNIGI